VTGRRMGTKGGARRRRWRSRSAALAGTLLVAAAAGAGCSAHPAINLNGGSVNGCFRDYPTAVKALHSSIRPQFRGVHRVPADVIEKRFPQLSLPTENDVVVCAFAFHGRFSPGQVDGAAPSAQGDYAVVLVDSKSLKVVRSFVTDHLPVRFGRRVAV
jgi:hypothetical protein